MLWGRKRTCSGEVNLLEGRKRTCSGEVNLLGGGITRGRQMLLCGISLLGGREVARER
ncbi:MAG TPA: hypothetical protein PLR86_07060 [Planctomycetota bacterium]|nr:hypothetical protein [Planctomycetota bacterium]